MLKRTQGSLGKPRASLRYLLHGRETSNFTYENLNEEELIRFCADTLGEPPDLARRYWDKLRADDVLLDGLRGKLREKPFRNDEPLLGYRRASYCFARIWKPRVIVETGLHDGLQASVLLRALELNSHEGSPGKLVSLDLIPDAGWLIDDSLRRFHEIRTGDVAQTLPAVLEENEVDFLIEDVGAYLPQKPHIIESAIGSTTGRLLVLTETDGSAPLASIPTSGGGEAASVRERPAEHFWPGRTMDAVVVRR